MLLLVLIMVWIHNIENSSPSPQCSSVGDGMSIKSFIQPEIEMIGSQTVALVQSFGNDRCVKAIRRKLLIC